MFRDYMPPPPSLYPSNAPVTFTERLQPSCQPSGSALYGVLLEQAFQLFFRSIPPVQGAHWTGLY